MGRPIEDKSRGRGVIDVLLQVVPVRVSTSTGEKI